MRVVFRRRARAQQLFRNPAQVIVGGFALAVAVGTVLLVLPVSRAGEGAAPL